MVFQGTLLLFQECEARKVKEISIKIYSRARIQAIKISDNIEKSFVRAENIQEFLPSSLADGSLNFSEEKKVCVH